MNTVIIIVLVLCRSNNTMYLVDFTLYIPQPSHVAYIQASFFINKKYYFTEIDVIHSVKHYALYAVQQCSGAFS